MRSFANGDWSPQDVLDGNSRDRAWDLTGLSMALFPGQQGR